MAESPESIVQSLLDDTAKLEQAVANDRREPHEMVFTSDILNVIERLNKLSAKLVDAKLARSRWINRDRFTKPLIRFTSSASGPSW
jgi:hypothetical protein